MRKCGQRMQVAIVQIVCPSYKHPMFKRLGEEPGIDLTLYVGERGGRMHPRTTRLTGLSHVFIKNRVVNCLVEVIWQSGTNVIPIGELDALILPEGVLYLSNYPLMLKAKWKRVPVGIYTHGFNHQRRNSWFSKTLEAVRGWIHRRVDFIVVYSEEGRQHIVKQSRVEPQRVFVAPNTLDVTEISCRVQGLDSIEHATTRKRYGIPDRDMVIVFPGRLEREKNPDWILYAVKKFREEGYQVSGVFIGEGGEEEKLRGIINSQQNGKPLAYLLGVLPAPEVDIILAASDVVAVPGMTGLAIVHAFACGKPYVTIKSKVHSPEIAYLEEGVTGLMTEPDKDAFYEGIKSLVVDASLREEMGRRAQEFACTQLSMERQVQGFVDALEYATYRRWKGVHEDVEHK